MTTIERKSRKTTYIPWVDKYRPRHLKGIVGNEAIIQKLIGFAEKGTFPNMSFIGPAGTGKTTAALCLINDTYKGKGTYKILNASDERGIRTIRGKIKSFASHKALTARFKTIVLDEADYLTHDAQPALREVIGQNQRNCRFILIANEGGRLIEAITSRCPPFYFDRIGDQDSLHILQGIAKRERMVVQPEVFSEIVVDCNGDLRTAITRLETACTGVEGAVTLKDVRFMRIPRAGQIEVVIETAMSKPFEAVLGAWLQLNIYISARRFLDGALQFVFLSESKLIDKRILAKCLAGVDWTRGSEDAQVIGLLARLNEATEMFWRAV